MKSTPEADCSKCLSLLKAGGAKGKVKVKAKEKEGLHVANYNLERTGGGLDYIIGTVKNNSSIRYPYVMVWFDFYDSSGAKVGDRGTNTSGVEPHGTWRFKIPVESNLNVTKVKLATLRTR